MGHAIAGQQHPVQHQNKKRSFVNQTNRSSGANFSAPSQSSSSGPMGQAEILGMLMQLIQQLITSLKRGGSQQKGGSEKGDPDTGTETKKTDSGGKEEKPTTPSNSSKAKPGEVFKDSGKVYGDSNHSQPNGSSARQSGGHNTLGGTTSPGLPGSPGSPGSTAKTSDYDTKFNIDTSLRDCVTCTKPFSIKQDHSGDGIVPSYVPSDFPPGQADREWGNTENIADRTFRHTMHVPDLTGTGEVYKSGTLRVEVQAGDGGNGNAWPLTHNDSINIYENGNNLGGASVWNGVQPSANQVHTPKYITIQLTPAQLASVQDGTFSFAVQDDTRVLSAKLDLQGGTPTNHNVINGTGSDDDLVGKSQTPDLIHGLKGDDIINGKSGDDCLYGDEGDDHVIGGSGNDRVHGGEGDDKLEGGSGDDNVFGGKGDDLIRGGSGADVMFGDEGDDTMHGGSGNDKIYALDGNDTVFGDSGDDHIYSGLANTSGTPSYGPGAQHNEIDGGSGEDTVHYAGTRDDYIITSSGNGVWEVLNKDTNKIDLVTHVEHLVFEMEMDPNKKVYDIDTSKSK